MMILLLCVLTVPGSAADPVQVVIEGSPPLPLLYQLDIDSVTVSDSSIALLQERMLQWYLEEGYPFASAGYYFTSADTLAVNTVPGRHALLEEVRIEGMPGTRASVFIRLLPMKPGESYSREAVEEWVSRLQRIRFVGSVGPTQLLLGRGGNLVLVQQLQKGSAGYFSASMDWQGDYLEGMGEILFLNLAGTARELEISGQTTEWGGLNAYLRYREPWLFGIPLSLQLELSQDTPESAWVNREGSITGIWSLSRTELRAGAGLWRGFPPDGERQEYDYGLAGIGYLRGRRVPQGFSGIELDLEGRSGSRTGQDSSGILTMAELTFRADVYSGLLGFGGKVLAGGVMQGDWFEGLLKKLGGQTTLRGYPENAFRGVRYAVARPEISLGETETRIYLFADLAVIRTDTDELRYPVGSGLGIRGYSGIFHADAAAGFPLSEGLGSARLYLRLTASL
ncbi:MAG: hypothetical protein JXA64_01355 [Candidatus Fermentibacteraceae bacterium]|nr:hypothetical protein [Candidatus Fermentibacteraceae bacterium]MBN2607733.1 hypothetical protein [Candidatus Fermentibacteraceae bacterium]